MSKLGFHVLDWKLDWVISYVLFHLNRDIDMMASLSIEIWNWIRVCLRSCLPPKMPKQGFQYIGLEIGLGHILCIISFLGIDMMASLSIGIGIGLG